MKKINRYIAQMVWRSVATVLLVIVALDFLAAVIDQLDDINENYTFVEAFLYALLYIPSTLYDYLPLSALVGCLLGLGVLASSSELVVIRAAGVSVGQIIWAVLRPVFLFIAAAAMIGEYVAPYTDQYADSRRALAQGHERALQSGKGVWNREDNEYMHFNVVLPNGKLFGVTRYKFDEHGKILETSFVESAIYQGDHWFEQEGVVTQFKENTLERSTFTSRRWDSDVSPDLLNVLVLATEELPMQRLYDYANYLERQNLDASEYRLAFWQKAFQPLATLSLVMIAISFILGPLRQVTMGYRVFVGVIVGVVFQTSQKLLGPASMLWGFSPIFAVLLPIMVCGGLGILFIRRAS